MYDFLHLIYNSIVFLFCFSSRTTVDGAPRTFHWVKKDLPAHVNPENHLIRREKAAGATTIKDMFLAHFDDDAFELLTLESNRFMDQCERTRCTKINVQELKTFVVICMYISIVRLGLVCNLLLLSRCVYTFFCVHVCVSVCLYLCVSVYVSLCVPIVYTFFCMYVAQDLEFLYFCIFFCVCF